MTTTTRFQKLAGRRDKPPVRFMDRLVSLLARLIIAFLYIPIVAVIILSFNGSSVTSTWTGFSLHWFDVLLHDDDLHAALRVTLTVAVVAASASTVIGLMAASAFTRYKFKGRQLLLGSLFVPLIVPEIVLGVALLSVFSALGIPLNTLTLILGHIVITLPYSVLILVGAYAGLDPSLEEAATDLGCNQWTTFTRVTLPLMRQALVASWLLCFVLSFGDIVMSTFTNGVGSTTLPLLVFSRLKTGITPEINALGTLLILLTFVVILGVGIRQMRQVLTQNTKL
ncbi:ABC transporter permease [Allobranchiibius huperziae]|uniref:ABC-type spermidine/putrescine transport system permease subunit II n=1 Tax=Allobranchiibius huperziae TaxID=1874116 RepID=A0A853DKT8_9MICO|nr:ABC transporter permease [Allobranchiibius huperziae]NYJ76559.1 ABC-type spermidine/putrescine transport system permease subunit II [Allobranchiibius huperziae]